MFVASDFIGPTGYSGKPVHFMVAIDASAQIIGLRLSQHREPIPGGEGIGAVIADGAQDTLNAKPPESASPT